MTTQWRPAKPRVAGLPDLSSYKAFGTAPLDLLSPPMHPTENYRAYRSRFLLGVVIPTVILPPILSIATTRFIVHTTECVIPTYALILLHLSSIPIVGTIKVQYNDWAQKRNAKRLGATMIPRVEGSWPGGVDLVYKMIISAKNEYLLDDIRKRFEEHGTTTLNLRTFWTDNIITIDEGVVKYVLATGFEKFDKGFAQKERFEHFNGNGIFNRDGEIWKLHRSMTRPFFARERISDFEHFEHYTSKSLDLLDAVPSSQPVDAQDLFARFTLDTASAFLFNSQINTLDLPLPDPQTTQMGPKGSAIEGEFGSFATAFEQSQLLLVDRGRRRSMWPAFELFKNNLHEPAKAMNEWLNPIIASAIAKKKSGLLQKSEKDIPSSFLDYLVASTDDVSFIRDELLNILLASRDTTASLLTMTIYMLAVHPDILQQLREETNGICPPGEVPTYESLRQMKFLRAVLNEVLRVFPPVPANSRASRHNDVTIPVSATSDWGKRADRRPLYMPADTIIAYFPLLIHRRKDLWGPDADEFDPNRWLDDGTGRMQNMVKNPLMFVPFNAGPRICLGQQFALNEASFFLVRLLQSYDKFELAPDAQPTGSIPPQDWKNVANTRAPIEKAWVQSALTMYVKGGLWVRFHKTENATA